MPVIEYIICFLKRMLMILKPPFIFGTLTIATTEISNHYLGVTCALMSSMSLGMIYVVLRKIKSNPVITVHYQNLFAIFFMPLLYIIMLGNHSDDFIYWKNLNFFEILEVVCIALSTFCMQWANSRGLQLETAWKSSV